MHITILALGSLGDVLPYLTLGRGLQDSGHQVRIITFESFAAQVAARGLDLHSVHGDARALVAQGGAEMLGLMRSFGSLAAGYARNLSDPQLGETDLILNQLPAGLYGYDLAEKYRVPMMTASVIPLTRTDTFPLMGFPRIPLPGFNRLSYRIGEQMGWQMFRRTINRLRVNTLGLSPLPLRGYFSELNSGRYPVLNGFSRHVVPRPADWGKHVHTTGYWFPEDTDWDPPKDLLAFLDAGDPPVFLGFGSMPVKDPARTTEVLLDAVRLSGVRAVLHAGWAGLGADALPEDIFPIEYAPYEWLFPRMAMVVHHGGSGTTAFGLRSGVPSCAVPFLFDQFYWGERVAQLGAGPAPVRFKNLSAARLRDAIIAGVGDAEIRRKAAEIGEKIRSEDGVGEAVRVIEGFTRHPIS